MKHLKNGLLVIMGVCGAFALKAQTPAATPGITYPAPASQSIIGNYVTNNNVSQEPISVTSWGGANAGMGWHDTATGATGVLPLNMPNIRHTDVAMHFSGECATVVYESNSNIFIENFALVGGNSFVNTSGPILISAGTGQARNPNIDAGLKQLAAITWEDKGASGASQVYSRAIEFCNGNLFPTRNISATLGIDEAGMPDVAVYDELGDPYFEYTYAVHNQTANTSSIMHHILDGNDLAGGAVNTLYANDIYTAPFFSVNRPRIAAHFDTGYNPLQAVSIVFETQDPSGSSSIKGFNHVTNSVSNIYTDFCGNKAAAITFTGCNEYVVSWANYSNGSCGTNATGKNILSRKLDIAGNPIGGLQWVNASLSGNVNMHALSGRFALQPIIMASTLDHGTGLADFKYTKCNNNPYMREASVTEDIAVYPNPSNGLIQVEAQGLESIKVFNLTGQLMHTEKVNQEENIRLDLTHLSTGMYLLEMSGKDFTTQEKINIQ